jgi:hypothetical protein
MRTKTLLSLLSFLFTFPTIFSQPEKQWTIGQQPLYKVAKAKGPITVDGKMDEDSWQNASVQPFSYFYRSDNTPEKQNTKFRMLWDNENLYLFYEMEDTSLTAREKNFDAKPYFDDCIEFFCMPVPDSIYMHFAFELNIWKVSYDFVILWKFNNGRHVYINSYNPVYKAEVTYNGTINIDTDIDRGWRIELAIPFTAFSDFYSSYPAKPGTRWAFQAVRQDRNFVSDKMRSTSTLFPIYDIRKDVHQPSRFGLLEFVE